MNDKARSHLWIQRIMSPQSKGLLPIAPKKRGPCRHSTNCNTKKSLWAKGGKASVMDLWCSQQPNRKTQRNVRGVLCDSDSKIWHVGEQGMTHVSYHTGNYVMHPDNEPRSAETYHIILLELRASWKFFRWLWQCAGLHVGFLVPSSL